MKTKQKLLFLLLVVTVLFTQCSKTGDPIVEARVGSYNFTTYTVDTIRFRIVVNGTTLGDSLISPVGSFRANVSFIDSIGTLQVFNADNNQLYIDTTMALRIGFSTISIVQIGAGQNPFIVPIPDEPLPAAGNYKVRFQYNEPGSTDVPFFDSVQCELKIGSTPVDTFVLHKYEFSGFYENTLGVNYRMALYDAQTGVQIENNTNNLVSTGFTDFNTASLFGSGLGGVMYNYTLQRIY